MSKGREIADYLDDIRTAIAEVKEFTAGKIKRGQATLSNKLPGLIVSIRKDNTRD